MKKVEMTITQIGNKQLYIPLSRKLKHSLLNGDTVEIESVGYTLIIRKVEFKKYWRIIVVNLLSSKLNY